MNVQKSLRLLHKNHERQEREKQRAHDEVARLKTSVSTNISKSDYSKAGSRDAPQAQKLPTSKNVTVDERKKQMSKLVEMGIAIPEEYRAEMAMAGDWHVVSETQPGPANVIKTELKESKIGPLTKRKSANEKEDDSEPDYSHIDKNKWGSTIKQYPGWSEDENIDLISRTGLSSTNEQSPVKSEVKDELEEDQSANAQEDIAAEPKVVASSSNSVIFKKRKKKVKT